MGGKNNKSTGSGNPTIGSIARLAGVSTATVSYALSGSGRVSKKKAEEIHEIARRVGYVPQHAARSLRKGQTSIIGLVVPNITNPIFTAMAQAIDECLHDRGYGVLLADSKNRRQGQDEAIRNLYARGADALIVVPRHDTKVVALNKKVVVIDVPGRHELTVSSDHYQGGVLVARHLIELGHKNILLMAGPEISAVAEARRGGMLDEFARHDGVAVTVRHSPYGPDAADKLLAEANSEEYTAVAAVSDTLAVGALRHLTRKSINVPNQVSVTGFDDTIWTQICTPAITTIHQDINEIAKRASALAIGEEQQSVTVPVRLVIRESTAPCSTLNSA